MISFTTIFKRLLGTGLTSLFTAFVGIAIAYYVNQYFGRIIVGISVLTGLISIVLLLLLTLLGKQSEFIEYDKDVIDKEIRSAFKRKE